MQANAYAAQNATTPLTPFTIQRRDVGKCDVQIDILYCGVCHSDLHTIRNEWQHNITSDIELIQIQDVNQAYDRLVKSDVKYRFVIDMASLKKHCRT